MSNKTFTLMMNDKRLLLGCHKRTCTRARDFTTVGRKKKNARKTLLSLFVNNRTRARVHGGLKTVQLCAWQRLQVWSAVWHYKQNFSLNVGMTSEAFLRFRRSPNAHGDQDCNTVTQNFASFPTVFFCNAFNSLKGAMIEPLCSY